MNRQSPTHASPPPDSGRAYALRIAYSYAEYTARQLEECERAHAAKRLESARYVSVRGFYENHLRKARAQIDTLRTAERQRLARVDTLLSTIESRRAELGAQVSRGRLTPAQANEQSRQHEVEAADLRRQATESRAILQAENAAALGGFIQRSFDQYSGPSDSNAATPTPQRRSGIGLYVGMTVAVVVVGLGLGVFGFVPGGAQVEVNIEKAADRTVQITMRNANVGEAQLFVPWPDGSGHHLPDEADAATAFGIQLYVRERGGESFRLLPVSEGCWLYEGTPLLGYGPVVIHPGLSASVYLDADRLVMAGVEAEAARLVVTNANGRELAKWEDTL